MQHATTIMHVPFEGPAIINDWLLQQRIHPTEIRADQQADWKTLALSDWLILMGGPMSVNDTTEHPWLEDEIAFIRRAIDAGKKVLGICLGAQLIARSLGAEVSQGEKEIGWFPIETTAEAQQHPLGRFFADSPSVLHWHGDRFAIPEGAELLASSRACPHQAFAYGDNVLALQCHLEMDLPQITRLCDACADELAEGGTHVQSRATLLDCAPQLTASRKRLFELLDAFNR